MFPTGPSTGCVHRSSCLHRCCSSSNACTVKSSGHLTAKMRRCPGGNRMFSMIHTVSERTPSESDVYVCPPTDASKIHNAPWQWQASIRNITNVKFDSIRKLPSNLVSPDIGRHLNRVPSPRVPSPNVSKPSWILNIERARVGSVATWVPFRAIQRVDRTRMRRSRAASA